MKTNILNILLCFFLLLYPKLADAQIGYIENNKQWEKNVIFKAELPSGAMFLEKNCITYHFVNEEDLRHAHAKNSEIDKIEAIVLEKHKKRFATVEEDKKHMHENHIVHLHAFRVSFENSNATPNITPKNPYADVMNFYLGNDPNKWASGVKRYKKINYDNLYKGIDLIVSSKENAPKYDFRVAPYGNVEDIVMKYEGTDTIYLENNNLIIKTSVNQLEEQKPYAYQVYNHEKIEVPCFFSLQGNTVRFAFPSGYDKTRELIIDPQLIFSTYTGSTADNWGFTATYDSKGNVYGGGIVNKYGALELEYPLNLGAYQRVYGGEWDIGIIKYSPDGKQRLFATYLGGKSSEMPHSMIVNEFDELLIFGTTGSRNYPTTPDAYDTTFNGGEVLYYMGVNFAEGTDIFVTKLSEDGTKLLASTYVGGSQNDGLNFRPEYNNYLFTGNNGLYYNYGDGARGEIITDDQNNVYVGSCSFSDDFPTRTAFRTSYSGNMEGVIFKLDYKLKSLVWSSYIGGSADDAIYSIDVDTNYDLYIAGGTQSVDFPTKNAMYENYLGGITDAFVAHVSQDGSQLITSTYFGSKDYDQAYFIRSDKYSNIYIFGQTEAEGSTLIKNAAYNIPNSGQFVTKFNNSISEIIWSTVFGTGDRKPNISPTAFSVDICDRIYLSGSGRDWSDAHSGKWIEEPETGDLYYDFGWSNIVGTHGMEITKDAYQDSTDGQDFYFMVLDHDASKLDYASYFGEYHYGGRYYDVSENKYFNFGCIRSGRDHVDGGTSRFDRKGNIFQSVCASCGGCNTFPVTAGAWATSNNSTNCNNAVIAFNIHDDILLADFKVPQIGCAPHVVKFENTSTAPDMKNVEYKWYFGDGESSNEVNPVHLYQKGGEYDVKLVAHDLTSCNLIDSTIQRFKVLSAKSDTLSKITICPGENPQIGIPPNTPEVSYFWYPPTGLSDPTSPNPFASPKQTTEYVLEISLGDCTDKIYQTVEVRNLTMELKADDDKAICEGDSLEIYAKAQGEIQDLEWSLSGNFTEIYTKNDTILKIKPSQSTSYYVRTKHNYCEIWLKDTINVEVTPMPEVEIMTSENLCNVDETTIIATSGYDNYKWYLNEKTNPIATQDSNKLHITESGIYFVQAFQKGCMGESARTIKLGSLEAILHNPPPDCNASQAKLSATQKENYNYEWFFNTTENKIENQNSSTLIAQKEGKYFVKINDNQSCETTLEADVVFRSSPKISLTISELECDMKEATITTDTGHALYEWYYNNSFTPIYAQNKNQLYVTKDGKYKVKVVGENQCFAFDSIMFDFHASPDVQFFEVIPECDQTEITLLVNAMPNTHYQWFRETMNTLVDETTLEYISVIKDGKYYVKATNEYNCTGVDSLEFQFIFSPEIEASAEQYEIIKGFSTQLSAGDDNYIFRWTPENSLDNPFVSNPKTTPMENTIYRVEAEAPNGCVGTDTVFVRVKDVTCDEPYIFVPNAFTPDDASGNNHILYVRSNVIQDINFVIYNRWGERVFETNNINNGWDGRYKGVKAKPAVFVYYLEATCIDGQKFKKKGNITLIR